MGNLWVAYFGSGYWRALDSALQGDYLTNN